ALALLCLDERWGVEGAVAWMRQAGTDPHYTGLYAAPRQLRRPTKEELDRAPAEFPEAVEAAALAQVMVALGDRWGRLQQARAAGGGAAGGGGGRRGWPRGTTRTPTRRTRRSSWGSTSGRRPGCPRRRGVPRSSAAGWPTPSRPRRSWRVS